MAAPTPAHRPARGPSVRFVHSGRTTSAIAQCSVCRATAGSGAAALAAAVADSPDVVVYDRDLPDLDGAGLAAGLRDLGGDRRPLLMSIGCTLGPRACDAGADQYLHKPADPAALARLLARFARLIQPDGGRPRRPDAHGRRVRLAV